MSTIDFSRYNIFIQYFLRDVANEIQRAQKLFPSNKHQLHAFSEEAGELVKEMMDLDQGKEGTSMNKVYREAKQAAAMAARVAIEGDEDFPCYIGLGQDISP